MSTTHPGLAILRALVPNDRVRRAFVAVACMSDTWDRAALIRAIHDANEGPVNITPAQAAHVRAFLDSI